jgi:hypothetical protein
VIDWDNLLATARSAGETLAGTVLDTATTERLLCDATLHRVILNGDSAVLDYGTASRTITAPMWAALGVRDRHCRFKGCDRPVAWCQRPPRPPLGARRTHQPGEPCSTLH